MKKYLYIAGGAFVALLLIAGGAVFFLGRKSAEPTSDITPTTWSQEGDYEIKTIDGKTIVANKRAGYSFTVPAGWRAENRGDSFSGENTFTLLSPDAEFEKDANGNNIGFLKGCWIGIETEYQKIGVAALLSKIESAQKTSNEIQKGSSQEKILSISSHDALETILIPPVSSELYKNFQKIIKVEMPLGEEKTIRFGTRLIKNYTEECQKSFDNFVIGIRIN